MISSNPVFRLRDSDPAPFLIEQAEGRSPFLLTCDHASHHLPAALGTLGLDEADLRSHIAWDIGAAGLARTLAQQLDAFLILQSYSRLAIDCNRPPESSESIVAQSAQIPVPGNFSISTDEARARAKAIFYPYHGRIRTELDARERLGRTTVLIALHSFTPSLNEVARPWHVGVLYGRDSRLGRRMLELLRAEADLVVGDNQPYAFSPDSDYTIASHTKNRSLAHVELEIRNDLITSASGQALWAERLARTLIAAASDFVDEQ